jgi:hypothetical protein
MPKHVGVDTLCITECILWMIYRCNNMHFTNNIKFQITNLTEIGFFFDSQALTITSDENHTKYQYRTPEHHK